MGIMKQEWRKTEGKGHSETRKRRNTDRGGERWVKSRKGETQTEAEKDIRRRRPQKRTKTGWKLQIEIKKKKKAKVL